MEFNKTSKTLIVCLIFIAGIACTILNAVLFISILFAAAALIGLYTRTISLKFVFICVITFLFSIYYTDFKTPKPDDLTIFAPAKTVITGTVLTQLKEGTSRNSKFEFEVDSLKTEAENHKISKGKTLVTIFHKNSTTPDILPGDRLEIRGSIKLPYKATNPGQFNYAKYLSNSGIFTLTYTNQNNIKLLEHPKSGKWYILQSLAKIKNKIISIHRKYLESPKIEILGGIVFGDYAVPTPIDIKKNFINSGLLHLLAASGMNVGLIFGLWYFLAQKISIPFKPSIITGGILVLVYAALTGMPPSVTRATWMLEFILLGKLINRQADNAALLALVGSIMLLFNPLLITNIGFQLSFLVTFGLLVCVPVFMERLKSVPAFISGSILIPTVAQLWAAPVQIYHFNSFAVYSLIANILVLPFIGIISFLGFVGSIFSLMPLVGEKICWFADKLSEPFIWLLLTISEFIANMPNALHYLATPQTCTILLFYLLILVFTLVVRLNFSNIKANYTFAALAILLLITYIPGSLSKELKLVFFDVGEADAIMLQLPDKKTYIIDTGDTGKRGFNAAKNTIIPYLRDIGINNIEAVILTHPDKDHIGGTVELLKNIKAKRIIDNGEKADSRTYKALQKYIKQSKIPVSHFTAEIQDLESKNAIIRIIRPKNTNTKSMNDESLIVLVEYKDFSALLMGDNEADSADIVSKYINEPIDLIKVGHHGSYNSVNQDFIDLLKPGLAVISVGKNKYNHPNMHTMDILYKNKIQSFRTDKDYAVEITTDGRKVKVKSYNNKYSDL